jgi:hypothetical protein
MLQSVPVEQVATVSSDFEIKKENLWTYEGYSDINRKFKLL